MPLPETIKWLRDRRFSIPTPWLQSTSPFYCDSTSNPRSSSRSQTTHSLQIQEICLPCLGHQFADSSLESSDVLRPEGHHRKECSRIPLRLFPGQNSKRRLGGQCGFLSYNASGLQYRPLVQKAISAQRVSLCYTGYASDRLPGLTSKINQKRKQESFILSLGLYYREKFAKALKRIDRLKIPKNL